jgi:hypothetical protein
MPSRELRAGIAVASASGRLGAASRALADTKP